jgi:DNA polymerase-1
MFDVLLVDGKHLLWRSADAFRDLWIMVDGERQHTGAVYGFLNVLSRIRQQQLEKKGIVVVCWEGGKLKRRTMFRAYKQRRDDLVPLDRLHLIESIAKQQKVLRKLLVALGVPQAHAPGWEADDVMGTLADRWSRKGKVAIFTGDRDLYQCIGKNVSIVRPIPHGDIEIITPRVLLQRYGVTPTGYLYTKALAGDTGDGIPGVRGVGEKTALKIVKEAERCGKLALGTLVPFSRSIVSKRLADAIELSHAKRELALWYELSRIHSVKVKFDYTESATRKQLTHMLMGLRFRSFLESGRFRQLRSLGCFGR